MTGRPTTEASRVATWLGHRYAPPAVAAAAPTLVFLVMVVVPGREMAEPLFSMAYLFLATVVLLPLTLLLAAVRRARGTQWTLSVLSAVLAVSFAVVHVAENSLSEPSIESDPVAEPTVTVSTTPSEAASPTPDPSPEPAASPDPDPSPTPVPVGDPPGVLAALDGFTVPRLVVEHDGGTWVRIDGGPWQLIGPAREVSVIGDGRWWHDWQDPDGVLRSVDDATVTCEPPPGFFDPELYHAVIHEEGLTSIFVTPYDGGDVRSVVCEEPGRPSPLTQWEPPRDGMDGEFGPIILIDDGVTLVLEGDAEGNVTVYDETGDTRLIDYAISGPYVDAERGLLVHVDIEGGMHFAGGTLVVSDLGGNELRRTDLGGTSHLAGIVDGFAVVERVDMPDFLTTGHVVVDLATGEIVADEPSMVDIQHVGT